MSDLDRSKWNQRYRENTYSKSNPVTLLEEWLPRLPRGRALDIACGGGRNALALARAGYQVDAVDIAVEGLRQGKRQASAEGLCVNWIEHDLDEPFTFDGGYNVIVVLWYVNLPLISRLCNSLAAGGYLLCEEHLQTEQSVIGPKTAEFRVAPGALRAAVSTLEIVSYREAVTPTPEGEQLASARVVATKNGAVK